MIHLNYAKIDFKCPYCKTKYSDENDKYLDRCNKNKNYCTSIKCKCGKRFGMSYNIMGNSVSFKLK